MTATLYTKEQSIDMDEQIRKDLERLNAANLKVTPPKEGEGPIVLKNGVSSIAKAPEGKIFTPYKGKMVFSLEGVFVPTPVVLLSGKNFQAKYLKQLEALIFNDEEEIDPDKLIHLIMLTSYVKMGNLPIQIVCNKYPKHKDRIVSAMNEFFTKNYNVLSSMCDMFTSTTSIAQPVEAKDTHVDRS